MRFPVMPAFRPYLCIHHRVQKNSAAIVAPRPPKINAVLRVAAGQTTSIKNKSCGFVCRKAHRSRDVAVAFTVNVTILENRRRLPENEIDVAFDIAVLVILASVLGIESVLPTEEPTFFEDCTVRFNKNCDGLRAGAE